MATRKKLVETSVLQLKITLTHTKPPIWRRLLVPSSVKLNRLHLVLNELMGWQNSHLHSFAIRDRAFADPTYELDEVRRQVRRLRDGSR